MKLFLFAALLLLGAFLLPIWLTTVWPEWGIGFGLALSASVTYWVGPVVEDLWNAR